MIKVINPPSTLQRSFAVDIVQRIRAAGFEALLAGGCVRDELLGRTPKDYDVATNATPDEVRQVFGRRRTLAIGAAFGVIAVLGRRGLQSVEVATFREDASYSDGRRPDAVRFSTAEADARRRDFTVNGLFFDPLENRVIDFVGGQEDLSRKVVRAIGDPAARLSEDKLRLIRAVRCAATLGFELDGATASAVRSMAGQIIVVSAERIAAELRRILVDASRRRGLELLAELGLLQYILPELVPRAAPTDFQNPDGVATLQVMDSLQKPSFPLALAAVLHRSGTERAVQTAGRRLRLSNQEIDRAEWILREVPILEVAQDEPWPHVQRILIHQGAPEAMQLLVAIHGEEHPAVILCREKLRLPPERLNPPPVLTGKHLLDRGLKPGPNFASLLRQVRDAQLEGRVADTEAALRLVDELDCNH